MYFAEVVIWLLLVSELHRTSKWSYIIFCLPFETKFHVLLSLRELLEGWTIFWPLSYKTKMKKFSGYRGLGLIYSWIDSFLRWRATEVSIRFIIAIMASQAKLLQL